MNWKDIYQSKLTTAENAVKAIQSGNRVVVGHATGEPQILTEAMVAQADRLENVEIVHMVAMGKAKYCQPGMEKHFYHNALFVGGTTRKAVNEGRADYTPCFFSEIPRLFTQGLLPVDVALIQISRPDEHGYCSFGVSVDYTRPAALAAKVVIAEANDQMPRTLGDSFIHVSQLDHIVETSIPLIELPKPEISEIEEQIGYHVAQLVEDGSTLQLGIGSIPDAVLLFLKDKKDLGIHTEMFSDGVVELVEAGVVTNKAKTLHPGKMVCTFLMGTKKLYDFVNNNPLVEMYSVDYTNNPFVIAKNHKVVSINSALQVDLTGQVCADTIGYKQYSGVGGQVDFVRGSSRSPGGKSIIAMPSTAMEGNSPASSCISMKEPPSPLPGMTSTSLSPNTVTPTCAASPCGSGAEALIAIAHPDFRESLKVQFEKRNQ